MSPRTDLVSFELATEVFGALILVEASVRPAIDQACPGNIDGIVGDVFIEGHDKEYACSTADSLAILRRVKVEEEGIWAEIAAKAEENHLEGATPARAA